MKVDACLLNACLLNEKNQLRKAQERYYGMKNYFVENGKSLSQGHLLPSPMRRFRSFASIAKFTRKLDQAIAKCSSGNLVLSADRGRRALTNAVMKIICPFINYIRDRNKAAHDV
jgi:hypothetical protein